MNTSEKNLVEAWARQWKIDNLTPEIRALIPQATNDLWTGGSDDPEYPGFVTACKRIREALEDLPSVLYVSTEYDSVRKDDPSDDTRDCDACDGSGLCADCEGEESCAECGGSGQVPDGPEDWLTIDRKALRAYIVGRDLAEYL